MASAHLQGHDVAKGDTMRDWYDNPRIEDILEEQASVQPNGALGILVPSEVKLSSAMPEEAVALLRHTWPVSWGPWSTPRGSNPSV